MLSLNHELIENGGDKPLDTLLTALKDEYKFDIDEAMVEINKEFDRENKEKEGAAV